MGCISAARWISSREAGVHHTKPRNGPSTSAASNVMQTAYQRLPAAAGPDEQQRAVLAQPLRCLLERLQQAALHRLQARTKMLQLNCWAVCKSARMLLTEASL